MKGKLLLLVLGVLALVLVALTFPYPVFAQAYQCRMPQRVELGAPPHQDGPPIHTPLSGYSLAVSWSPEYCHSEHTSMQCSGRNGRFGFVVHGLWPESASGPSPQWCAAAPRPAPELIGQYLCMTPVPSLLEHEWAKHGTCMAASPQAYYRATAILWRSLHWPDADRLSRKDGLTAGDLRRAVAAENPDWHAQQIGLLLGPSGWLRELRMCYGRDFMPADCPRRSFGPDDAEPIKIWRGL